MEERSAISGYFLNLREINQTLASENNAFRNRLEQIYRQG